MQAPIHLYMVHVQYSTDQKTGSMPPLLPSRRVELTPPSPHETVEYIPTVHPDLSHAATAQTPCVMHFAAVRMAAAAAAIAAIASMSVPAAAAKERAPCRILGSSFPD